MKGCRDGCRFSNARFSAYLSRQEVSLNKGTEPKRYHTITHNSSRYCAEPQEGQLRLQAFALLQLQLFDAAAALEDLEADFDLPSAKVPRELFEDLLRGLDKEVGHQHPIERVFPGGWIDLGGEQDGDGDGISFSFGAKMRTEGCSWDLSRAKNRKP